VDEEKQRSKVRMRMRMRIRIIKSFIRSVSSTAHTMSGRIAQVVERPLLDRKVRGSNPSHDTMALLLGRHYEFPQCGIIKGKLSLLLLL
jgi:hypothetical protein